MKVLNYLTLKHLRENSKRTIVTIIGIILSTALMVGIGLLFSTFIYAMRSDAESYSGSHHASFNNVSLKDAEALSLNINFKEIYQYGVVGFASVPSNNDYKPYLYVVSGDEKYFAHEKLVEGRLPVNNTEIVLSNHYVNSFEGAYKVGDKITLSLGQRVIDGDETILNNVSLYTNSGYYDVEKEEKFKILENLTSEKTRTYTVVGIVSRSVMEDYSSPGYMAFTINEPEIYSYNVFGIYKDVKKSYSLTSDICSFLSSDATCQTNDSLLYYYGVSRYTNINRTVTSLMIIALSLISVGAIVVIYNSFAISMMERKKSFGLYSSLGATPKQLKYTVFFEAFFVGFIGITLGLIGAFLGIYILVQVLRYLLSDFLGLELIFHVEPFLVVIPIIFMILVIIISAFIPARRASKVSAVELLRENDDIKLPRRSVKVPKWIRKIFGMEGEIALKNIKRNKRKYRITLFSLFISIVLFLSFSTYLVLGLSVIDLQDVNSADIIVSTNKKNIVDDVIHYDGVQRGFAVRYKNVNYSKLSNSAYSKEYLSYIEETYGDSEKLDISMIILDNDTYDSIAKELQVPKNKYILYNTADIVYYNEDTRKAIHTNIFADSVKELTLEKNDQKENLPVYLLRDKNETINLIIGSEAYYPVLFLSEDMYENLKIKSSSENNHYSVYLFSEDFEKVYEEIKKKYSSSYNYETMVVSPKVDAKNDANTILALKILFYGFITLVTLIGVTSVFNTIYTSIHLRRKEFAMLRSVGLSPRGFNKMLFFESFFFGMKALLYSLPVSFIFIFLINDVTSYSFDFGHLMIPWTSILIVVFGVFLLILVTMLYSAKTIKKENILESLKDDNI